MGGGIVVVAVEHLQKGIICVLSTKVYSNLGFVPVELALVVILLQLVGVHDVWPTADITVVKSTLQLDVVYGVADPWRYR